MKKIVVSAVFTAICLNVGAQSLPFLLYNTDARNIAIASVAREGNAASAALSGRELDISASYGLWAPETTSSSMIGFGGYGNFNKVSVGLSARYKIGSEYDLFGPDSRYLGTSGTGGDVAAGASFAYRIAAPFSVGVRVNYISSTLAENAKASAVGADIFMAYSKNGFQADLAVRNIGSKVNYGGGAHNLPALASAGASYSIKSFAAHVEAGYVFSGSFMAGAGAEYTLIDIFTFRAGFHYGDAKSVPTFVSLGLGINYHGAMINAAYLPAIGGNGSAILVGVGYSF